MFSFFKIQLHFFFICRSFNPATGRGGIIGAVCEAEWGNSKSSKCL